MQTPMREKVEDVSHDETRAVERTENGFDETPPASERESLMATPTREQVEEMLTFCKEQRDWFENRACSLEEERDKAFAVSQYCLCSVVLCVCVCCLPGRLVAC